MANTIKIVLSGYYGFDNIGDEAVLYAIIKAIKNEIKEVELTVLSNNPEKTKALYGVHSVNRWQFKEVIRAIKESDLLVSGGGSLLQDVTSSKTIPYYLAIVKIAQLYKKKVVFYSQGIGPVQKGLSRLLIKHVVSKVDGIFVRDAQSKKLLQEIGIKKEITLAIDPVLGIHLEKQEIKPTTKTVGIYIRPWLNKEHDEKLVDSMSEGLTMLLQEGYKLCFIPMHYHQDREIAQQLVKSVEERAIKKGIGTKEEIATWIEVVDKSLSIKEVLAYTSGFQWIIGMRLHSLIMAAACQVPMIGISYDPKVTAFMKEMEIPYCLQSETLTAEKFIEALQDLKANDKEQRKQLKETLIQKEQRIYLPAKCIKELLTK